MSQNNVSAESDNKMIKKAAKMLNEIFLYTFSHSQFFLFLAHWYKCVYVYTYDSQEKDMLKGALHSMGKKSIIKKEKDIDWRSWGWEVNNKKNCDG